MSLELNLLLFITLLLTSLIFWFIFKKQNGSKIITRVLLALSCSLMLPAFIPGHGEIIVALPNGALFGKFSSFTLGFGLFFVFVYSCFLLLLLNVNNNANKHNK